MKILNAKDNMSLYGFNSMKMPKLKGHVKITLHNPKTGKNIVEEGDNIVTSALADIFQNDYLSAINIDSMSPLWEKWFGGILCFASPHPLNNGVLDPDDYFPQADSDNHLTAHAGQTAIDVDHDDDFTRGNPAKSSYIQTDNSIKQVFEWSPTHGNGIISALSLTHSDTGSYGLGNESYHFKNSFEPFASIGNLSQVPVSIMSANNLFAKYDDNHGIWFHIGDEDEFYQGHTNFQTKKLTVIIKRLPFSKTGLFETMSALSTKQIVFVVELTNYLYLQPAYYFDYENKKLWIFNNVTGVMDYSQSYSNSIINYAVIDCESQTVESEGTIESDTNDIAPLSMTHVPRAGFIDRYRNANIIKDGNYFYFPTTNSVDWGSAGEADYGQNVKGLKKININNQSDQSAISFNTVQKHFRSSMKNGGIILNGGRVINGDVGYACLNSILTDTQDIDFMGVYGFSNPDKVSSYVVPIGSGNPSSTVNRSRFILANKMILSTKYNVNPVQKTSSYSMIIEYTLQEESEND